MAAMETAFILFSLLILAQIIHGDIHQDYSWLGYVTATASGSSRVTHAEAKWKAISAPASPALDAYYARWFGIETADEENVIQCANPQFSIFGSWMWNEVFQHLENSDVVGVPIYHTKSGDILYA